MRSIASTYSANRLHTGISIAAFLWACLFVGSTAWGALKLPTKNIPIPEPRPEYTAPVVSKASAAKARRLKGVRLSLADAVFLGVRNNRAIQSAYINRIDQKFSLRVAEESYSPKFNIAGSLRYDRIAGKSTNSFAISPGMKVSTKSGERFEFAWNNTASGNSGDYSGTSSLSFSIIKPLLRGGGRGIALAPLQTARLGELVNKLQLKAQISETVGSIITSYRALLLAQEELKLAYLSLERNKETIGVNKALIDAGRLPVNASLEFEADAEEQKIRVLKSKQALEAARLVLLDKIGIDFGTKIVAREALNLRRVRGKLGKVLRLAFAERPDYLSQLHVIAQLRIGVRVADNARLWTVDLFTSGRAGIDYAPNVENTNVFDISAGMRFELPVRDLTSEQGYVAAGNSVLNAELQLKNIRNGIEQRIRQSLSDIDLIWRQLALTRNSVELARKLVEVEQTKLKAGRSSTFELRALENRLRDAESQNLSTQISYLNALTRLDLETGTTLDTWKIRLRR